MTRARSMTGFAEVRRRVGVGEAVIGLKSVNHRGLDLHFHLPAALDPLEPLARAMIQRTVARGHVQVRVTLDWPEESAGDGPGIDAAALERWARMYREASRILGSSQPPDPADALRAAGVTTGAARVLDWSDQVRDALVAGCAEALAEWNDFRDREGAAIAKEMEGRAVRVRELARGMEEIRGDAVGVFHARLRERLAELLRGAACDPQRLAQEAALLAERSDISEELMRLNAHAAQFLEWLKAAGEKGKKLDFLLQEMNRETNTVLSKTSGLGDHGLRLTNLALEAKGEIDKMREQSLNLE